MKGSCLTTEDLLGDFPAHESLNFLNITFLIITKHCIFVRAWSRIDAPNDYNDKPCVCSVAVSNASCALSA